MLPSFVDLHFCIAFGFVCRLTVQSQIMPTTTAPPSVAGCATCCMAPACAALAAQLPASQAGPPSRLRIWQQRTRRRRRCLQQEDICRALPAASLTGMRQRRQRQQQRGARAAAHVGRAPPGRLLATTRAAVAAAACPAGAAALWTRSGTFTLPGQTSRHAGLRLRAPGQQDVHKVPCCAGVGRAKWQAADAPGTGCPQPAVATSSIMRCSPPRLLLLPAQQGERLWQPD